jgi:type I restriction enzyme S subunit
MISGKMYRFRVDEGVIDPRYVEAFLQTANAWYAIDKMKTGGSDSGLNLTHDRFRQLNLPIAPVQEQRRIVAEIEKQFTRLDAAATALKRVQANLKRYRASVLKAACEGRLVPTEAELARKEGRDYEPAEELLQRILRERRTRWEADTLTKMIASGKPPKDDRWKERYNEPSAPDDASLTILPDGWHWTTVDSLIQGITAGRSFKCEERPPQGTEFGVVKVSAVTWGVFNENESKTCLAGSPWVEEFRVRSGDFLFSRANTIELVGACVIVGPVDRRLMLSDKILRFEYIDPLLKEWLLIVLRSIWGRSEIERLATGNQESMRNIGQDRIRRIHVPLAPRSEMQRIITAVGRSGEADEATVRGVNAATLRLSSLRRIILRDAFSGRLVAQDAADEPASVLLERIRTERTEAALGKSRTRRQKEATYA